MSGKGFSITRAVLVIVLLAALLWAGRLVNGPVGATKKGDDDDHDATPPAAAAVPAKAPSPDAIAKMKQMHDAEDADRKKMAKEQAERSALAKKLNHGKDIKDPTTTDISSDYWTQNKMGQAGLSEMDQKLAKEKADYDAIQAKIKKEMPVSAMKTPGMKAPETPATQVKTAK